MSEKKTNKKRKIKKLPIIICIISIVTIIIISISSFNFYKLYKNGGINIDKRESLADTEEISISIETGSTVKQIASVLKENNIIDNSFLFVLKSKKENLSSKFQAGDFVLHKNMSFDDLTLALQNSTPKNQLKLLVKEGETQDDIAKKLDQQGVVSYDDFMDACNNTNFDYDFLNDIPNRESRLEGYLYPDTYFLSENETAESIINKLLSRFDSLYTKDMAKSAEKIGLTTDEVVIIASIIEKEIKYSPEKSVAASVIFNRLEQGMKLQMDATILYAKKEHTDRTLISDTKIESPYNTYYVDGLPIGPISNPSISSIEAVLNPADTDYLYYVVKDDATGEHFYTANYDEFLKAKQDYIKKFDK